MQGPLELQAFLHPRLRCTTAVLATHSATPRPNRVISKRKGADRNLDWLRYFDVVRCCCVSEMRLRLPSMMCLTGVLRMAHWLVWRGGCSYYATVALQPPPTCYLVSPAACAWLTASLTPCTLAQAGGGGLRQAALLQPAEQPI